MDLFTTSTSRSTTTIGTSARSSAVSFLIATTCRTAFKRRWQSLLILHLKYQSIFNYRTEKKILVWHIDSRVTVGLILALMVLTSQTRIISSGKSTSISCWNLIILSTSPSVEQINCSGWWNFINCFHFCLHFRIQSKYDANYSESEER